MVLVNGDRITGEIKSLEYNQLKLSTYHMGTIYIEWDKIASLQSDQYLLLERTDGTRYYVKRYSDEMQARSEVAAARVYEALGVATVAPKLITMGGRQAVASVFRTDLKRLSAGEVAALPDQEL